MKTRKEMLEEIAESKKINEENVAEAKDLIEEIEYEASTCTAWGSDSMENAIDRIRQLCDEAEGYLLEAYEAREKINGLTAYLKRLDEFAEECARQDAEGDEIDEG